MPLTSADQQTISQVVDLLRPNLRLLFLTGAGLSADSGLPTYRGHDGIYQSDRLTRHGIPIEQALSESMLVARPDITWEFLVELERVTRRATFNRGHQVIAEMESHFREVWTLTQNIDGLHRAAGARNVIDIHGDLHELRCNRCTYRVTVRDYEHLTLPPRCPLCSDFVRPDVVLYGEEGRIVQTLTQRVGRTTTAHIDLDLFGPLGATIPLPTSSPGLAVGCCPWPSPRPALARHSTSTAVRGEREGTDGNPHAAGRRGCLGQASAGSRSVAWTPWSVWMPWTRRLKCSSAARWGP
jgi:NAD-dependent SIR2 family protein deacetylase